MDFEELQSSENSMLNGEQDWSSTDLVRWRMATMALVNALLDLAKERGLFLENTEW